MKTHRHIILWTVLLYSVASSAQQLRFKHITSEDGLSTNSVKAIIQDQLGFMWFATQDGLNKYDGYQIKTFRNDPTNPNSLSCSDITTLKQVSPNLIMVGTREGLDFFDPITEKFSTLEKADGRLESKINTIFKVDTENVLVGTEAGLFSINITTKKIKNPYFKEEGKVSVKTIERIDDVVYIGTQEKGLWMLTKKNTLERINFVIPDYFKNQVKEEMLLSITHIGHYGGKMYLGTYGAGIFKVDRDFEISKKISFDQLGESSNYVKDFVIRNNKIFAATAYGVLVYSLLNEEINIYTKQDAPLALNSNPCNCIFSDSENNFWVGTDLGGVNISFFRSQKFPNSNYNYESRFSNIYAICEVNDETIMLGGEGKLQELNLTTGSSIAHDNILKETTVLSIVKETDNIFWIGTWGNGIIRYDKSTKKGKNFLTSDNGGTILCLAIIDDQLFAGSIGDGLFRIDLASFDVKQYTEKDGLPNLSINTIFRDTKRTVWLGMNDGGLVKLGDLGNTDRLDVKKVFANKGKAGQIASNMVLAVNEDNRGNIWAATSTGLSKLLPDGSFYNFYNKDGLSNTYLYSLLKDSLNNFWMSTNGGIVKFNPAQPEKEIAFKNYNIKDGLINTEYNMGAACTSTSGMMYFGGPKGFNAFRPTSIHDNLHVPQSYVRSYKRSGTDVLTDSLIEYKKFLELNWKENYFQFELVAIDYTDPGQNKFRYKLEGYDKDWSAPTNVRFVSYTELPGGNYTFKVKAANNDGIWNEKSYELHIDVIPPFWKTKLFYFLVIISLIAAVYFYTRYRTKAFIEENKILEQKVAERTRELEEKNRDITSSIQYAKRIQEAILPSKDYIFTKLNKAFILYQPKDIVSGDFYWFSEEKGIKIFAVVDCTGHGVPGAFMSMIGHNLLHQIVSEKETTDPGQILDMLHKGVQDALRQGHNEVNTNDGMDVSLIAINDKKGEIKWAGANRPLVIIDQNKQLTKYDGNKFPIGGAQLDHDRRFTTHTFQAPKNAMAYMSSDGYADQFGGDKGKKFMVKRFHDLLENIYLMGADQQREALRKSFEEWKAGHEQVDDVLIVGIEI
ncbi:MAG: triple tyrosine motif-containing protein [bacterium]|nr:triple tyrosine motif-containing protein [bacterium]